MKKAYVLAFVIGLVLVLYRSAEAAGPNFGPLTGGIEFTTVVLAILAVMASLAGFLLASVAAGLVLDKIKGSGVSYGGKRWDSDVYYAAMSDIHRQQRKGVLLDPESARALREYKRGR